MNAYETYLSLGLDGSLFSLEQRTGWEPYFCYPVDAKPIGYEGCILYCFLPQYGEMVFAVNPENYGDSLVYPLASNFEDFVRLLLACGSANPIEQIVWMDKTRFEQHVRDEAAARTPAQQAALDALARGTGLSPMGSPYEYVKAIQKNFDGSRVRYSEEYYDVLGLEQPD